MTLNLADENRLKILRTLVKYSQKGRYCEMKDLRMETSLSQPMINKYINHLHKEGHLIKKSSSNKDIFIIEDTKLINLINELSNYE